VSLRGALIPTVALALAVAEPAVAAPPRISRDGSHWNEPVATGAGQGQLTTIDIAAAGARFLRVVQTATAPQWWSIADLRVYR
jgi:hypothetical protein